MRLVLRLCLVIAVGVWGALLVQLTQPHRFAADLPLPTLFVLPSLIPSSTPTLTPTPSPSLTPPPTATSTPTLTPTLSTRVLSIRAVMPGVVLSVTPTPFPPGTILLPAPPEPLEPLPDATEHPPPYEGWFSFESDHPLVTYLPPWEARLHASASRGQYHRTEDTAARVTFAFAGEALRVRYVAARNMGRFDLWVDGVRLDTIDAYASQLAFPATRVYALERGPHLLELRPTGTRHAASEGYAVALDAVQVFRGSANTLILTPVRDPLPSPTPRAVRFAQVSAPPTLQATATPRAPQTVAASVVIAYDENGNRAVDPAEGVRSVSVRAVEVGTNRVLAQTLTDARGYARLEAVTASEVRIVVPYFGRVWEARSGREAAFTLLIAPGNQPGLIP